MYKDRPFFLGQVKVHIKCVEFTLALFITRKSGSSRSLIFDLQLRKLKSGTGKVCKA